MLFNCCVFTLWCTAVAQSKLPAYPLITHNPYFSIWSNTDKLNESFTKHWTGRNQSLVGIIKVDNQYYRFMGENPPEYKTVLSSNEERPDTCRYITDKKAVAGWEKPDFNDEAWQKGPTPFGDNHVRVGNDIWFRRKFNISELPQGRLMLKIRHGDEVEIFLNGQRISRFWNANGGYEMIPLVEDIKNKFRTGENTLAVHCRNYGRGTRTDVGFFDEIVNDNMEAVSKAEQKSVNVTATQTIYSFKCGPADLRVTFTSPLIIGDVDLLGTPVSYITCQVNCDDGKRHTISVYQGVTTNVSVNQPWQQVQASAYFENGLRLLKAGTVEQPVLQKKGDDVRID